MLWCLHATITSRSATQDADHPAAVISVTYCNFHRVPISLHSTAPSWCLYLGRRTFTEEAIITGYVSRHRRRARHRACNFGGGHFGGRRAFAGGHFDPRFDRQFGKFRGRAIFGFGDVFLGYDFGYGLGYGYPGYYPAWYCSHYPYGYNPAVGCYYPYPYPWSSVLTAVSLLNRRTRL